MANLQYGDIIKLPNNNTFRINRIEEVVPIKFDVLVEQWIVCSQENATHMLIVVDISNTIDHHELKNMMIEIGKCDNIFMLADAIVD